MSSAHDEEVPMAKLTIGDKAQRVLKLLYGLRDRRVAEALALYGFTEADRDQGWVLLQSLAQGKLLAHASTMNPKLYEQLDDWENRWYPIASASLKARFPKAHAWLFLNLQQTSGLETVISVGTLVERIEKLADAAGDEGPKAKALLEQRGLNAATLNEAKALLAKVKVTAEPNALATAVTPEQQAQSEAALWAWYLEWSEIARVVIRDKRLLRELGFQPVKRAKTNDAQTEDDDEDDEDDATSPSIAAE
jgi:hypothetical protein